MLSSLPLPSISASLLSSLWDTILVAGSTASRDLSHDKSHDHFNTIIQIAVVENLKEDQSVKFAEMLKVSTP